MGNPADPGMGPGATVPQASVKHGATIDWPRLLLAAACVFCVSVMEYRAVLLIQRGNFAAQVDVAAQILQGHPYWKSYQNRLLGPEIVLNLALLVETSFAASYQIFCFAALCLANSLCFFLFHRHGNRTDRAAVYTVLYAALFVGCQDAKWLYLWDFIDLSVMLLFAWAVVLGGARLWQLAALFAVELFNRESAVFVALWIVIDSVRYGARSDARPRWQVDFLRLAVGAALGIVGVLWTNFIRDRLLVQISGTGVWEGIHETARGQLFVLPITLRLFEESSSISITMLFVILGGTAFFLARAWHALGERAWQVLLFIGALMAANFCFAYVFELRVWLTFFPLVLCLVYLRQARLESLPGSSA